MLLKKELKEKENYKVNKNEYFRLLAEEPQDIFNYEGWSIFYKWVAIHKSLNNIFMNNTFVSRLIFDKAYSKLIRNKNEYSYIGNLTPFSFDHTSSMQLRSDVSQVSFSDTVTGVITFPYINDWNDIKKWIDCVSETFSVYIINPVLINYGIGTVGLFLTPKFYNGMNIELCNRFIISLTGYPLFLTFTMDETVDEINYVDLGLCKEDFVNGLFSLTNEGNGLLKMLNFWKDNDCVSIPLIEEIYDKYLDFQPYHIHDHIHQ